MKIQNQQLCYGVAIGIMAFAGLRATATFIEALFTYKNVIPALMNAGASMFLLPLTIGLLYRSRVAKIITQIYLWFFVIGNTIVIPFYFFGKLDPGLNLAAICASWIAFIIVLVLLHMSKSVELESGTENQILDPTWTTPVLKAKSISQAGQD